MALPAQDFQSYFNTIANGAPSPVQNENEKSFFNASEGAGATAAPGAQAPAATPASFSASAPAAAKPAMGQKQSMQGSGSAYDFGNLFAPVTKQTGAMQGELQKGKDAFYAGAGPSASWETKGGQSIFDEAFKPTGDLTKDNVSFGKAADLMDSQYLGPTGFDQGTIDTINKGYQGLNQQTAALGTQEGAADLVRQATHGTSGSEQGYEGQALLKNQGYQAGAQDATAQAGSTYGQFLKEQGDATAFATQRGTEEAGIAQTGADYATGKGTAAQQAIQDRMTATGAKEQALAADYDTFNKGGDLAALQKIISPEEYAKYDNATTQRSREGDAARTSIMTDPKWADLKDTPTMELSINSHGREQLQVPKAWWKENTVGMSKKQKSELKRRLTERQLALEEAGFTPGSGASANAKSKRQATAKTPGKYSDLNPLYYGDDFEGGAQYKTPQLQGDYIGFQQGDDISRENMATGGERSDYNIANRLLGRADQIGTDDPYVGSQVLSEGDRFKTTQDATMKDRQDTLKSRAAKQVKFTKKARSAARDQPWDSFGDALDLVSNPMALLPPIALANSFKTKKVKGTNVKTQAPKMKA